MGSKTFDGVRFAAYSDDHPPTHVHGCYGGVEVIVEFMDGGVDLVRPQNTKQSDVRYVLETATKHADQIVDLWRIARG